jgi:DNA-binding PadR family transcriptional regulator
MAKDESTAQPLTPAVFHVLLALADGATHGYAVMQAVESTAGFTMGPGTVYGTLQRLEDAGLVRESAAPRGADDRRRYWRLTPTGRTALRAESTRLTALAELVRTKKLVRGA